MKSLCSAILSVVISSHPARGAWIEIDCVGAGQGDDLVAPRKGCVD